MTHRYQELRRYFRGWVGYFGLVPIKSYFSDRDKWVRRRIRSCCWNEWKNPRTLLALFSYQKGLVKNLDMDIETLAGIKKIAMTKDAGGNIVRIQVNMGKPILDPKTIPAVAELNAQGFAQVKIPVQDRSFDFTLVSMGNPHAVTYIQDVKSLDVEKYGKPVEWNTALFPRRTNVEFIEVFSRSEIAMRVWERGSGETLACGTGACASVVSSILNGLTDRKVIVHLLGGDLEVEWLDDGPVMMTGNASVVFEGIYSF